MKRLITVGLALLLGSIVGNTAYAEGTAGQHYAQQSSIQWESNYAVALQRAKQENKPLFVLFTGSDWCSWCIKLEEEVLATPVFAEKVGNEFVFVRLDFPMNTSLSAEESEQNKALKSRFKVQGFPTVLILTPNEERIASTGYRSGGAGKYSEMLKGFIQKN